MRIRNLSAVVQILARTISTALNLSHLIGMLEKHVDKVAVVPIELKQALQMC